MKRLAALAILAGVLTLVARDALAAPRANGPQECLVFADMALVARAAAEEGVGRAALDRMALKIYQMNDGRVREIAGLVVTQAYRERRSPLDYAVALAEACMKGGNLDPVLGGGT